MALEHVAYEWVQKDPVAVAEWLIKLPEEVGNDKNAALGIVAEILAEEDPVNASKWAIRLPEGKGKDRALEIIVYEWVQTDFVAVKKWIESLDISQRKKRELMESAMDSQYQFDIIHRVIYINKRNKGAVCYESTSRTCRMAVRGGISCMA